MNRHGATGHRPARPGEQCGCGQPGAMTWLDRDAHAFATTCGRDEEACTPPAPAKGAPS